MTRPDATLDQLHLVIDWANAQHLHDAEQWLRERVEAAEERMGVRIPPNDYSDSVAAWLRDRMEQRVTTHDSAFDPEIEELRTDEDGTR